MNDTTSNKQMLKRNVMIFLIRYDQPVEQTVIYCTDISVDYRLVMQMFEKTS